MALIERLCQIEPDEPGGEPYERHIPLNPFCEALYSVLGGYHTNAELKAFWDMTTADETEYDALVTRVTAYPNDHRRNRAVHRVRSILTFWEMESVPGYMTVAQIRAHFNAI